MKFFSPLGSLSGKVTFLSCNENKNSLFFAKKKKQEKNPTTLVLQYSMTTGMTTRRGGTRWAVVALVTPNRYSY